MPEFFCGWRRKTGCVALVVALALTSGWLRSFRIHDQLWFAVRGDVKEAVISLGGNINWLRYHKDVLVPVPTFPEWETSGFDDVEFAGVGGSSASAVANGLIIRSLDERPL